MRGMAADRYDFTRVAELHTALCQSTEDYIYMCDMSTNTFHFPPAMVEEFALPGQVVEDAIPVWGGLIHPDEQAAFYGDLQEMMDGKHNKHCQEYRARNRKGNWVWMRCRGYLCHDDDGKPTLFAGVITNLGKRSKIDYLSGLPNKYEFENLVVERINACLGRISILLLGLDNFKHINNLYGWDFGDEVIRQSAQKLQSVLPNSAKLFRLDGDVFGVLLQDADEQELVATYERVLGAFGRQQELDGHRYYSTLSGGGVVSADEKVSFYTLFKRVEYALEYSKNQGKNCLNFYNADLMGAKDRLLAITDLLRESVDNGFEHFELYFQPQVDTQTREVVSAEALLRWRCDQLGTVSPVEFVPLLEQTGLIHPVGRWVMQEAVKTCVCWRSIRPDFAINVNLSYLQLQEKSFILFVSELLQESGLHPSGLHVEITESRLASDSQLLTDAFDRLRALGVSIEMDDFGTGYSSLELLKNQPADMVKIDRAFVKDITNSDFDATFIRFVVALCHSVDIKVCLEGVEQWDEYDLVKLMDVDLIQGFLFGKPQPADGFASNFLQ